MNTSHLHQEGHPGRLLGQAVDGLGHHPVLHVLTAPDEVGVGPHTEGLPDEALGRWTWWTSPDTNKQTELWAQCGPGGFNVARQGACRLPRFLQPGWTV